MQTGLASQDPDAVRWAALGCGESVQLSPKNVEHEGKGGCTKPSR